MHKLITHGYCKCDCVYLFIKENINSHFNDNNSRPNNNQDMTWCDKKSAQNQINIIKLITKSTHVRNDDKWQFATERCRTSLDFAVSRFLVKLFRTSNAKIIAECQRYFGFSPSSGLMNRKRNKFVNNCNNVSSHFKDLLPWWFDNRC